MMRKRKQAQETDVIRNNRYLTLLPEMVEGNGISWRAEGIISAAATNASSWLMQSAGNIQTDGVDVGYAIPDVMAGEAQLRRWMGLLFEEALLHQEVIDWRATLAVLLLWDGWSIDPRLKLQLHTTKQDISGTFARSVLDSLAVDASQRASLELFVLSRSANGVTKERPLGMVSDRVAVLPAANPGNLTDFLPRDVRWYDSKMKRFVDPCPYVNEYDRRRLIQRLRCLRAMNEYPKFDSPLYDPKAELSGMLRKFIDDLVDWGDRWKRTLSGPDIPEKKETEQAFYTRTLAVCGLYEVSRLSSLKEEKQSLPVEKLRDNLLLQQFGIQNIPNDDFQPWEMDDLLFYTFQGHPFAVDHGDGLLAPANMPDESGILSRLQLEYEQLLQHDVNRSRETSKQMIRRGQAAGAGRVTDQAVADLYTAWGQKLTQTLPTTDQPLSLTLPASTLSGAMRLLLKDQFKMTDPDVILGAFSDCLLLCDDGAIFETAEMAKACAVQGRKDLYAIPPIGEPLARWLALEASVSDDDQLRPKLPPELFRFEAFQEDGAAKVKVSMSLTLNQRASDRTSHQRVDLTRVYTLSKSLGDGQAVICPAKALPTVRCWPAVRLTRKQWKVYYVLAQRPGELDIALPTETGWEQGLALHATDSLGAGQTAVRHWQTAKTSLWPLYVTLRYDHLSLGALPNDQPLKQLRRETPARIAIDFGSNATTMMMRQSEHNQPALPPSDLLKTLLCTNQELDAYLPDEFLPAYCCVDPKHPTMIVSVMDMFSDDISRWNLPLQDGHIYYAPDLETTLSKNPNVLYYDLKWGEEGHLRSCLRLFMKQAMLQATLAACMSGSPSVSWRISMPNVLPLTKKESFLNTVRGLATELEQETGVPLTKGEVPVSCASENHADGLYFLSQNEVNTVNGYLNMDIGGGTTDLSVWLNNSQTATLEASLLLGCRQILFDSLSKRHRDEFVQDFAQSDPKLYELVQDLSDSFANGATDPHTRLKNLLLLDSFFAEHSAGVTQMMAKARAQGGISLLESLLLFNIGFLFRLCGELLDQCYYAEQCRAQLKGHMQICVAGNGGQFLNCFDETAQDKLYRLALSGLNDQHPVQELFLVLSHQPKQEVATGLLYATTGLAASVQGLDTALPAQAAKVPEEKRRDLLKDYLINFYTSFPQAGDKLLGKAMDMGNGNVARMKPNSQMELQTIMANEMNEADPYLGYVNAFAALKRIWHI